MTDIRAVAIDFEAKVRSWSKRANGEISLGLIVHADDAHKVGPIEPGRRFQVAAVELGDDEQPTQAGRSHGLDSSNKATVCTQEPASGVTPARAPNKLAQLAGIICNDPLFWKYVNARNPMLTVESKDHAADFVRWHCDVKSRADLLPGSPAAEKFQKLYDDFRGWSYMQ